ncbi:MAG TPA: O-antigen ligase family protein [Candidatus Scybalousia intestinigallinarum]|nr:O-antigen ligase family protein [Candidatus Scybalousia intestinigallinarum]
MRNKNKSNWIQKNISLIILIFLYMQPIIDLFTSFCIHVLQIKITLGIVIRVLFLLFLFLYYLLIVPKEDKKKENYLIGLLVGYLVLFLGEVYLSKGSSVLFYELSNTIRAFYFPFLLVLLFTISKKQNIIIEKKHFVYIALIYIFFIIIPTIFGLELNGYTEGKTGNIGWFNSSNEISAVLSIAIPFIVYYLIKTKGLIKKIFISLAGLYVIFNLGSKIVILSLGITLLVFFFFLIKKQIEKKNVKIISLMLTTIIVVSGVGIVLIPKTNFYQNIKIHLDFLEVDHVTEIFTNYELFDHFVFSSRLSFLEETASNYHQAPIIEKLLGIGYIENYGTLEENRKTIEIDPFDILFRHGIVGFLIYMTPFIYCIVLSLKLQKREDYIYFLALGISIVLMCLSGHVLTSPAVSIFVALILITMISKNNQNRKEIG